jgi:NAD(P)-dependent dehydrogenase (short-subunit alcohol dehydrogenase family)
MPPIALKTDRRVVIITGGGGELGRGIAAGFARDGAAVVLADLKRDAAEAAADKLRSEGYDALPCEVDVTDSTSTVSMAQEVEHVYGRIDVLVNNAGLYGDPVWTGPVLEIPDHMWDDVFNVNVHGILLSSRAVAPVMRRAGWGRIVNISSMGAYMLGGAYSASKLAVHHLTWSLAHELGDANITVNCIAPGTMNTDTNRRNAGDADAIQERVERTFIVKRTGRPEDLYAAARYFASPEAEWCTGQVLLVNGGVNVRL